MPILNKPSAKKFVPEWVSKLLGASWNIGPASLQYVAIPIVISGFLAVFLVNSPDMAQRWVEARDLKNLREATYFAILQFGFIALWVWLAFCKHTAKDHFIALSVLINALVFSATNEGTARFYVACAIFVLWDCPASRELRAKSSSHVE
jgi:hypothetical protein